MNTTTRAAQPATSHTGSSGLAIVAIAHPQGCRSYLIADPTSRQALALDVHHDFVAIVASRVRKEGWTLAYVMDSHTHADHPSGSSALAAIFSSTRIAHAKAGHAGVARHPEDGEKLHLGDRALVVRHAPGHTPDHMVLIGDGVLFAGDTLLIDGVARTDFLGGDAGELYDSIHRVIEGLHDNTVLYPGHDYQGRESSTIGIERSTNAWLRMDRADFAKHLVADPPPRPANMDDLLRLNREGVDIPASISAAEAVEHVRAGGAASIIDVRTAAEYGGEYVEGSRLVPLDQLAARVDEVQSAPAPRLLLCRSGTRAAAARRTLLDLDVSGLCVIDGGIEAYRSAGGDTQIGRAVMSLERQVRIAAGLLVLCGVTLGVAVHPALLGLAAFVGAGLTFAGITDWCGMGLLLARAPWNRRAVGATGSSAAPQACAASAPAACAATAPAACAARPPGEN